MPGTIRLGNAASDIANALGAGMKGKVAADDKAKAEALRERMAKLEEDKLSDARGESATRHREEEDRLGLMAKSGELEQKRFDFATDKDRRELEEKHTREMGLRDRLNQLVPGIHGLDAMGEEALMHEIAAKEGEVSRLKEIKATKDYNLSRQLEIVHRQQEMANTSMLTIRRLYNDTATRVMTDPQLMQQYGNLLKANKGISPESAMQQMVKQVAGYDVWTQYLSAAQMVQQIGQQAYAIGGKNGSIASPLAQKAVQDAMPYQMKSPEEQAKITSDIATKLKAGQPLDIKTLTSTGVPVSNIAQSLGFSIDPTTGAAVQVSAPPAAGAQPSGPLQINQPGVMPAAAGRGMASLVGGMFGGGSQSPALPNLPGSPVTDPMSGQVMGTGAAENAGASGSRNFPAPAAAAVPNAAPAVSTPPNAAPAAAGPSPFNTGAPAAPIAQSQPLSPSIGADDSIRITQLLRHAPNLPQAETYARTLLNLGVDYNTVVTTAPQEMQAMLGAKLPKRIPPRPLSYPAASQQQPSLFTPPDAAPSPLGNPANRPLFTPPGV